MALAGPVTHFVLAFFIVLTTLGLTSPDPFDGSQVDDDAANGA